MGPQYLTGTTLFSSATRALVEAMKATGPKRLIAVTGAGAGDSRGRLGFVYNAMFAVMLKRVYDDKDVQERIIRDSGLDWTIVRPVLLNDGAATGKPRALVDPKDWHARFDQPSGRRRLPRRRRPRPALTEARHRCSIA